MEKCDEVYYHEGKNLDFWIRKCSCYEKHVGAIAIPIPVRGIGILRPIKNTDILYSVVSFTSLKSMLVLISQKKLFLRLHIYIYLRIKFYQQFDPGRKTSSFKKKNTRQLLCLLVMNDSTMTLLICMENSNALDSVTSFRY